MEVLDEEEWGDIRSTQCLHLGQGFVFGGSSNKDNSGCGWWLDPGLESEVGNLSMERRDFCASCVVQDE